MQPKNPRNVLQSWFSVTQDDIKYTISDWKKPINIQTNLSIYASTNLCVKIRVRIMALKCYVQMYIKYYTINQGFSKRVTPI